MSLSLEWFRRGLGYDRVRREVLALPPPLGVEVDQALAGVLFGLDNAKRAVVGLPSVARPRITLRQQAFLLEQHMTMLARE